MNALTPAALAALDLESLTDAESVAFIQETFGIGVADTLAEILAPEPYELTPREREYVDRNVEYWKSQAEVVGLCAGCVEKLGGWTTRLLEVECEERARYQSMTPEEKRLHNERAAEMAELKRMPRREEAS